ncbi:hypothetical protein [Cellulomonas sp. URHE0023]|uniref:hypothetical protein n=1 Tax=Cellulomonas sp. URHE0023 TaxID=1380354 RepID=UPI0004827913|nr:hypothetical protein [Cellulomonas sp. URHE0023]
MVAARKNRTAVVGVVQAVREVGSDVVELEVEVQSTRGVEGQPDLLTDHQSTGRPWTLQARRSELPEGDLTGWHVSGEAVLAGPDVIRLVTTEPAPVLSPPGP